MISEKKFLLYRLDVEKRFSDFEHRISELSATIREQKLRHKMEMQRLEMSIAHDNEIKRIKAEAVAVPTESEEEKRAREEEEKTASAMLQYSQDADTLRRLGFKVPGGGGNE